MMLRGNGLIKQFDNSSFCFVSSLQCTNARISVMRIISSNQCSASDHFTFLKLIKIREMMRVFTWSFGVWKNHHEIEEGSRRLLVEPGWLEPVLKAWAIREYRWAFLVLFCLGVTQLMSDPGRSRPHRTPSLSCSQTHFSWFRARREKWNRGFMLISQIGGEFIWSVYQQWWVLKWPQTWTINCLE